MEEFYKSEGYFTKCWVPELGEWVSSQWLSRKLAKIGMTSQDWYDKYILKINSIEDRPKCSIPGCPNFGKELPFLGVTLGYAWHCNHHCKSLDPEWHKIQSDAAHETWKREEYREHSSCSHSHPSDEVRARQVEAGLNTWRNPDYYYEQSALIAKGSAMRLPGDYGVFYYIVFPDYIKIGFSTDPISRIYYVGGSEFEHHVFGGNKAFSAQFEYDTKLKYRTECLLELGTEYFKSSILDSLKSDLVLSKMSELSI